MVRFHYHSPFLFIALPLAYQIQYPSGSRRPFLYMDSAMYTYSYTCIQVHAYNIVAIHEFARKCDDIVDRYPGAQQSICGQNKFLAAFPGTAWSHLRLFGGHLGAILGPSWRPVGPIWGHLAPTSAIMDYRGSSCGLLRPSWGHLGAILRPSWGHLGPSWDHLEAILGTSWGHLGPFHSYENH